MTDPLIDPEIQSQLEHWSRAYKEAKAREVSASKEAKAATDMLVILLDSQSAKTIQLPRVRATKTDRGSRQTLDRELLLKAGVSADQIAAGTKTGDPSWGVTITVVPDDKDPKPIKIVREET